MAQFNNPYDIANRALQHLGAARIATFGDNSKNASEMGFNYDKLRRAELRSHVWRFSARRAALRPVTASTQIISWPAYAAGTTYSAGQVVQDTSVTGVLLGSQLYLSLFNSNVGNAPSTSPSFWTPYFGPVVADTYAAGNTYSTGEIVVSGGSLYLSIANGNIGNAPPNATFWVALSGATYGGLFIPYPIGQASSGVTRTIYRLPNGYMRVAPQDVKTAGVSVLLSSAGMQWSDFDFEGQYLLTSFSPSVATNGPLLFRFCADVSDVTQMDDMFGEGLAARMAMATCETLTQSKEKYDQAESAYDFFIAEAKRIDAIERGSTEPLESELRTSRLPGQNDMPAPQQPAQGRVR